MLLRIISDGEKGTDRAVAVVTKKGLTTTGTTGGVVQGKNGWTDIYLLMLEEEMASANSRDLE